VDLQVLIARYPVLYHMAEDGAWPSIRTHGLLSTRALLDLYDPPADVVGAALGGVRRTSIELSHPVHGTARIRDQAPLKFLDRVLTAGTTTEQFLDALNGRVFFWLTEERLRRLLEARLYRRQFQTVLRIDTDSLMDSYGNAAELAPYNTGSMHVPTAPQRGLDVFTPVADYPYEEWVARRRRDDPVVELTVPYAVPDLLHHVIDVTRWYDGEAVEGLFP
jgi:hypothetical protein